MTKVHVPQSHTVHAWRCVMVKIGWASILMLRETIHALIYIYTIMKVLCLHGGPH